MPYAAAAPRAYPLRELARHAGCEIKGDSSVGIDRVCTLRDGASGGITFLANRKYARYLADTKASAVILRRADAAACPVSALVHDNPYACYAKVAQYLSRTATAVAAIDAAAVAHPTARIGADVTIGPCAVVEAGAKIGSGAVIGPGCVVGERAEVGARSRLHANVTIYQDCRIGTDAIVHAGAVIGADGFGLAREAGVWVKVPQLGRVIIGDHVEIGAGTTIDRGAIGDTVIGDGVKLDNQIQIGHNVVIGEHSALAGCVGVAGSAEIGKRCTIGGGAVVLGHLKLADDTHITAMSMVTKSITAAGAYSSGTLLQANAQWKKNALRHTRLDEMARRVNRLENTLRRIEQPSRRARQASRPQGDPQ